MLKTILTISVLLVFISFSYAQQPEQVTITTYYPLPYGSYRELRTDQMSVGSGYRTASLSDGNLLVSGNVGIGTNSPQAALDMGSGGIRLGGVTRTTWPLFGSEGNVTVTCNSRRHCGPVRVPEGYAVTGIEIWETSDHDN